MHGKDNHSQRQCMSVSFNTANTATFNTFYSEGFTCC